MSDAADPTMQLLADLEDPTKFRRVERVSVFRPHTREQVTADGKKRTIRVTDADLPTIAEKTNAILSQSGRPVRLTLGHVKQDPNFPEHLQPKIVGFAKDYRAEVVQRPAGTLLTVTHTEYLRADEADEILRQYPFRSPEYDPVEKVFGGVALLTRDPWLDTGAVYVYGGDGVRFIHYQAGGRPMADGNTNYAQTPQQKAAWATAHKDEDGEVIGWDSAAQRKKDGYQADDDWTPEEEAQYAKMARYMKKKHPRLAAYMDDPASTNTQPADSATHAASYQKTPEYAALEAENLRLSVERELDQLAYQGVRFDRSVELPRLVAMTAEQRTAHVAYMKTHYAKSPVGGGMVPVAGPTARPAVKTDKAAPLTPVELTRVVAYQRDGVPYENAVAKVLAER